MSIAVVCTNCSAKLNAPDSAAGKKVKCPKCQTSMIVPEPLPEEPAFEVVDEPEPAKKPKAKATVADDEEEEEKPRKNRVEAESEEEEKPRKKRQAERDEDDEERPKKKRKKQEESEGNSMMVRNIIGGVVLLVLLGVAGWVYYDKFGKKDPGGSRDTSPDTTPPNLTMPQNFPRPPGGQKITPVDPGGNVGNTPNNPNTLTSPAGFKVTFPGPYKVDQGLANKMKLDLGLDTTVYVCEGPGQKCAIAVFDLPPRANASEKKGHYEKILEVISMDLSPVSRRHVVAGGLNWEEVARKSDKGTVHNITRLLQTNTHVLVLATDGTFNDAIGKFFDSFELVK
jgi:hypothetical protein